MVCKQRTMCHNYHVIKTSRSLVRAHAHTEYHLPVLIKAACLCVMFLERDPKLATRSLKSSHL